MTELPPPPVRSIEDDRLIGIKAVCLIAGLGKSRIYALVRQKSFPQPCKPGGSATRWSEFEVRQWRDRQKAERAA